MRGVGAVLLASREDLEFNGGCCCCVRRRRAEEGAFFVDEVSVAELMWEVGRVRGTG